ncbi:MAG TPA: YoaK family protein [Cellulomonas sp.]|uniref:YoaK family protein n=1 Tax=Cellulomonas sp. TaxID=40001 RepID=UPI002E2FDA15|nr:YoaK family protein [Cellulomonas sp.]HEX5333069.1 YoaK family protein [Cellulomonas sp.]
MRLPSPRTLYPAGLLILTAATGTIDAVSYLALDRVFTGNMTGNVLFIGFALAGVDHIPLLNNAIALAGFVLGSILGARVVGHEHPRGLPRVSAWLLATGCVLAALLATAWALTSTLGTPAQLIVTALLAGLMGAQVAAVKPVGNVDITTIVVTSTLANLSRDSRLAGGRQPTRHAARDRLLAVIAMGIGATVGAGAIRWTSGPVALGAATAVFALGTAVLILGRVAQRRADEPSTPTAENSRATSSYAASSSGMLDRTRA